MVDTFRVFSFFLRHSVFLFKAVNLGGRGAFIHRLDTLEGRAFIIRVSKL